MVRLTFGAIEMAGRMMSSEIGLPPRPAWARPWTSAWNRRGLPRAALAVVLFFLFGGHLEGSARSAAASSSFRRANSALQAFAWEQVSQGTSRVIELGLRMSAPFIALNFLVNLAFSTLGRAVPRMNVFVLSFSLRVLVGFGLLSGAGTLLARYLFVEFSNMPAQMLKILPVR